MSQQLPEEWFVRDASVNAAISWSLTVVLVVTAFVSLLEVRLVATAFAAVAAFVALVPALVHRSWRRTVPWPLLVVGGLPVVLRAVLPTFFAGLLVSVAVAGLAMLVVVCLQLVTSVRMTPGFAVFFVVLATLGVAGFWAVGSAVSARYLGTPFAATNRELMEVFTATTVAGLVAGTVYRWYFRRLLRRNRDSLAGGEAEGV